jgi:flagellar FliL protein
LRKMLPWLIVSLLSVTLIVGAAFLLWNRFELQLAPEDPRTSAQKQAEPAETRHVSAEELKELTFSIEDITANLSDQTYFVNASFTFEMDSKKAKHEFELLDFKMKDLINTALSDFAPQQVKGSKGIDAVSSTLLNRANDLLQEGKVRHVYVTKLIVTEQ